MPTVARNIVDTLVESGVKRVYGIPGDSLNGFTDALRVNPELEWSMSATRRARPSPPAVKRP